MVPSTRRILVTHDTVFFIHLPPFVQVTHLHAEGLVECLECGEDVVVWLNGQERVAWIVAPHAQKVWRTAEHERRVIYRKTGDERERKRRERVRQCQTTIPKAHPQCVSAR